MLGTWLGLIVIGGCIGGLSSSSNSILLRDLDGAVSAAIGAAIGFALGLPLALAVYVGSKRSP